jgi:hypothetical protein
MKRVINCSLTMIIMMTFLLVFCAEALAQKSVEGTLTVNNETYPLKHAYVYQQEDEVVVALTDNPVTQDNVPFDLADLAYEGKIHGISLGLSKEQKNVKADSVYHVVYHKIFLGRGALADPGKLTINQFDDKILDAVITVDKPTPYELFSAPEKPTYQYTAAFKSVSCRRRRGILRPFGGHNHRRRYACRKVVRILLQGQAGRECG